MALKLNDRVKETSTTTGTGTLDLSGAVSGFETFVEGIADGNTTYYAIVNRDEDEWETGLGTVTDASTDTLARTTVFASSNSDSAVDFSAGTKDVFCTLPASKTVILDSSNNLTVGKGDAGVDYTLTFDGADADGLARLGQHVVRKAHEELGRGGSSGHEGGAGDVVGELQVL